jgi:hypothetical protein
MSMKVIRIPYEVPKIVLEIRIMLGRVAQPSLEKPRSEVVVTLADMNIGDMQ